MNVSGRRRKLTTHRGLEGHKKEDNNKRTKRRRNIANERMRR
jgi:hypothetical protein